MAVQRAKPKALVGRVSARSLAAVALCRSDRRCAVLYKYREGMSGDLQKWSGEVDQRRMAHQVAGCDAYGMAFGRVR